MQHALLPVHVVRQFADQTGSATDEDHLGTQVAAQVKVGCDQYGGVVVVLQVD